MKRDTNFEPYSKFVVSDEFHLLSMLSNIGVINPERSLTVSEIAEQTRIDPSTVSSVIPKLVEAGYLETLSDATPERYHLTTKGIRKVLSIYS